jgi:hypothetical protein
MPFVSGFLRVFNPGHRPDQGLPGTPGHPDQGLPGDQPGIDNSLPGMPVYPDHGLPPGGVIDNELPKPPPGIWPPPSASHPIVPAPPGTPPGVIWPPIGRPPSWGGGWGSGNRPDNSLPESQPGPDNSLPGSPAMPDQGLPHPTTYWVVVGIPGVGWRYTTVDPSLQPTPPMAPGGMPQPK